MQQGKAFASRGLQQPGQKQRERRNWTIRPEMEYPLLFLVTLLPVFDRFLTCGWVVVTLDGFCGVFSRGFTGAFCAGVLG